MLVIYGVRITVNTGIQIAVDNIAVVNPRALVTNTAPIFVQAGTSTLNINENVAATDIKALLHISDTDASQTETWTQSVAPTHGTLSFGSATASSGSADIITAGTITYTPTTGYAGTDTFTIQISDGTATTTRVINVNVTPLTQSAPDLVALTDTGSSNTDNRTNAALLNFTGTSAAGDSTSKVWMFIDTNGNGVQNAGENGTSAVLSNGRWTLNGLSTAGVADGTYNLYAYTTTAANTLLSALSTPITITIDKTEPDITHVSIANVGMKVVDTVNATLTVANYGGDTYTLGISTIDGFTVSHLIRTNATTYTAQFTVIEGGADIAAASAIPLSLILIDTAGNSNTAYTTVISQAADAMNANSPTNMALSANTILTSAANNAVVGVLSSTDATSGDSFTYTLVAGAGSTDNASFNISWGNLQATTPSSLTAGAKSVRVRTTDVGGNFYEQTFSITVSALNTTPTFTGGANTGLTILEDAAITTITTVMLRVTDAEQAAAALTYTIRIVATKGTLSKSTALIGAGATFTQADINNGLIKFTPALNANGGDSDSFSISDGAGGTLSGQTFNFTITPVADTPSVTNATTATGIQTTSGLVVSRNAVDGTEVTHFKITNIANGILYQNDGVTQITANSFITFAQANADLKLTPSVISNGNFDVQASTGNIDAGLGGGVSMATISLDIAIANANTNEDTSTGAIVITGNTGFYKITGLTTGTLYSDAGFTTPIANGGFIATSGATTNVYFRPAADFNGTANFTVQGSGSNSDAGLTGNTATSTITVNPVNDAPTGSGNLILIAVDEDTVSPAGGTINTLTGFSFADSDAAASLSGIAVIANTVNSATQGV